MQKNSLLSAVFILISATAGLAEGTNDERHLLNAPEIRRVEDAVRNILLDPESARFYNLIAEKGTSEMITVCGEVNGKNTFGGYAGKLPFTVFLMPHGDVPTLGDTPLMLETVDDICRSVFQVNGIAVPEAVNEFDDPAYVATLNEQYKVVEKFCLDGPAESALAQSSCDMRDMFSAEMTAGGLCLNEGSWQHC